MQQLVTLPRWECRAPAAFRRRGERYWLSAEIPLGEEWIFLVNTAADDEKQLPQRSIVAVGANRLLGVLDELGPSQVRSVYQLFRGTNDDEDALMVNRLTSIHVGEDSQDGWRKVFIFHVENGTPLADQRDLDAVERMTNRVEVARFSPSKTNSVQPIATKG
jgi:hypothetical protein